MASNLPDRYNLKNAIRHYFLEIDSTVELHFTVWDPNSLPRHMLGIHGRAKVGWIINVNRNPQHICIVTDYFLDCVVVQQPAILGATQMNDDFGTNSITVDRTYRIVLAAVVFPQASAVRPYTDVPGKDFNFAAHDEPREKANAKLTNHIRNKF